MLNAQKSAPINDCGNFSGPGTKYKDPTTDSSVSRKSLVCTTPYRSPNLGSGFHHQRQVRVPKKQSGDEHPHTHASSEAVYAHMCESDSSESKAPSHGPGAIVNLKSPGFVHKLDLPACPTLRALPSLQHRPFNLAKSVDDLIRTRATALSAARALRREQEATFAPPQADLQKEGGHSLTSSPLLPTSSPLLAHIRRRGSKLHPHPAAPLALGLPTGYRSRFAYTVSTKSSSRLDTTSARPASTPCSYTP